MSARQSRASEEREMTREESPAEEHPADAHRKMEEEIEAISDLDPASPRMALSHNHRAYRTVERYGSSPQAARNASAAPTANRGSWCRAPG